MGGAGGVAGAAANDQAAVGLATGCYFLDMVGGQVGAQVGGLALPAGAPITHHGAMVGDDAAPSFPFLGVVL